MPVVLCFLKSSVCQSADRLYGILCNTFFLFAILDGALPWRGKSAVWLY